MSISPLELHPPLISRHLSQRGASIPCGIRTTHTQAQNVSTNKYTREKREGGAGAIIGSLIKKERSRCEATYGETKKEENIRRGGKE